MVNILFAGNIKVFDGALTELISICNRTKEPVTCYLFTMDVSRINKDFVPITDEQVEKYKASIQNIKDCIQIFYDILVWLQNNQSINTVHAINVFADEDVD